ncbi:MAG: ABC transporter ATP-binding protein [Eubacterium sp.]|nr:ABC transporter ATP-binding protein [Eubacterium sp.]
MENILEIRNLTKYYGKTLAVQNLSMELRKGEIFGFIGPNGAGKSTTIRSILNLINKSSGEVLFEGKIFDKDSVSEKTKIGYLPSEIKLYEELTVKQMLDFHESFYGINCRERRNYLVDRLQLDESKKIEDLSLGNMKKCGIVLALMHSPKLVILDEPTSGLDPIIQQRFYELLLEEKEKGTTIFYSTHILPEISKVCDRVGIIKAGKLLKVEGIHELKDKSLSFVTVTAKKHQEILEQLDVEATQTEGDTVTFKNTLNPNELIQVLAEYDIEKIYIEQASMEDIFIHYYEQGEEA